MNNNGWNEKIEESVSILCNKSGIYRIMHDETKSYYFRMNRIISIISVLLVSLTATGAFSTVNLESDTVIKVIVGTILYMIALVNSLKETINPIKLSEQHKLFSIRFSALYHNIQRQLVLDYSDRENGKDYYDWINTEFDNLLFSNPEIPEYIKKNNISKFDGILNSNSTPYVCEIDENISLEEISSKRQENPKVRYEIERYQMHN